MKLAGQRSFRDHAGYSPERIDPLRTQADSQKAKLVTTEKDGAKLASMLEEYSIYQLSVSLTVTEGRSSLLDRILDMF